MHKSFSRFINDLADRSGYEWDYLIDRWVEMVEGGDVDRNRFIDTTMAREW